MEFSAKQIAELIQGRVEGDENATVHDFAKIEEGKAGAISFLSNPKYTHYIYDTESSIVLVDENVEFEKPVKTTLIRVKNAYEAVAKLLQLYESFKPKKKGIDSLAFIDPTAKVGKDCYIGPFVSIAAGAVIGDGCVLHPHVSVGENATVGDNTEIYSNAVIYHHCKIGNNCILHAGCVIGADGFGFAPSKEGYDKIPQIGIVTIEDNVEIGANTCVDRSTMGSTFVRKGVKLDNLVQTIKECKDIKKFLMSEKTGIAATTNDGKWCMLGAQVDLAGHIKIGNRVMLGAQSGVPGSIKDGEQLIGTPPMPMKQFFRSQAIMRRLPDMYREMDALKKQIAELQSKIAER